VLLIPGQVSLLVLVQVIDPESSWLMVTV